MPAQVGVQPAVAGAVAAGAVAAGFFFLFFFFFLRLSAPRRSCESLGLFLACYLWYLRTFPILPSPATLAAAPASVFPVGPAAAHADH